MAPRATSSPDDYDILEPAEVAAMLHVPVTTLTAWRGRRRVDGKRQGPEWTRVEKKIVYLRKHIREYLDAQVGASRASRG
jgi:hypothetical protein